MAGLSLETDLFGWFEPGRVETEDGDALATRVDRLEAVEHSNYSQFAGLGRAYRDRQLLDRA